MKKNCYVLVLMFILTLAFSLTGCGSAHNDRGAVEEELTAEELTEQAREDLNRMVQFFYPWFEADIYCVVSLPDQSDGLAPFHIVASYRNNPDFKITFYAYRTTATDPDGSDVEGQAYYDTAASVWWIHPQIRTNALDFAFGSRPLMTEAMLDQIAAIFLDAHPGKLITAIADGNNVDLTLMGIDMSELDNWGGDSYSFKSVMKLDLASGAWLESEYHE